MLDKKQYIYTLVIAILVFAIAFAITFFYMKANSWNIGKEENTELFSKIPLPHAQALEEKEVCILPQTQITLKNECKNQKYSNETRISNFGLLGLNQQEIEKRFHDYKVELFSEKQVVLVKQVEATPLNQSDGTTYVLGVEDQYVCIKEKDSNKRPVKMDYEVNHFSKYIYSLLLNEEIEITPAQKEALLLKPSKLQSILQGYMGE